MNVDITSGTELAERTRDAAGNEQAGGGARWNSIPMHTYYTGLWLLVAAVVMLFAGLTSALVVRKGISEDWRPLALPPISYYSTSVLLLSGFWMERFRRRFWAGASDTPLTSHLIAVCVLGVGFALAQIFTWLELRRRGIYMGTNPSASFYYLLSGVYGALYWTGLGTICYLALPLKRVDSTGRRRTIVDVVALGWHCLTGLWIYLLVLFVTIM
jgi:cytochrome c oxidase subunit 3